MAFFDDSRFISYNKFIVPSYHYEEFINNPEESVFSFGNNGCSHIGVHTSRCRRIWDNFLLLARVISTSAVDLSDNHSGNASSDHGLIIPLTPSVSLDLRLSSVDTGQAPTGENQSSVPPIPIPKAPGSDLRYSRLGVGLSFRF